MVDSRRRMTRSRSAAPLVLTTVLVILGVGCAPRHPYTEYTLEAGLNSSLESRAVDTKAYLNSVAWSESPVHLVLPCSACAQNPIVLDVYLNKASSSIDLRRIIKDGRPGHLVAKIKNNNNYPYAEFGLGASDSVFLWVGKTSARPAFATFHIDAQGVATGLRRANRGLYCPMSQNPNVPPVHEMPYPGYTCEFPETVYGYPVVTAAVAVNRLLSLATWHVASEPKAVMLANGDLWFSCSGGCCQADSWALY